MIKEWICEEIDLIRFVEHDIFDFYSNYFGLNFVPELIIVRKIDSKKSF